MKMLIPIKIYNYVFFFCFEKNYMRLKCIYFFVLKLNLDGFKKQTHTYYFQFIHHRFTLLHNFSLPSGNLNFKL